MGLWDLPAAHSVAVITRNRGLMVPWGELTAPSPWFWGGIFFLFSLGSLAPALHGGLGLISYLLQRIFSVMVNVGAGFSLLPVPASLLGTLAPPMGTLALRSFSHSFFLSSNVLNSHPVPGPEPGEEICKLPAVRLNSSPCRSQGPSPRACECCPICHSGLCQCDLVKALKMGRVS